MHSVSVAGAVIDVEGRFLAIRRADNGRWELPGGVLEADEEIEAGVRREVHEETGIRVRVGPLTGVYKNIRRGIVALVFHCFPEGGDLSTTDEATEVAWLSEHQVHELMLEAYACRLLDAATDGPPSIRTHDGTRLL
ncbi:NUDIX domain-containing protein [Nocardiopsis sp. HNM0947]|uniref:NUDIX domain-containing protein n=1 Tax=Nocardiopsis coralli TaxID=2772213 RepID=A0ABR9P329_9ACTN|nr:NUDIX domain-containing protein [Nocardiopsis coralli]MBE2998256.1 NUDIX domain-containing protein [Nocardiopsis coralli]